MVLDQEIKQALTNWKTITRKYIQPDTKKAVVQLLNTFLPFLSIWIIMYFTLNWSIWLTLGFAVVNGLLLVRLFVIQHDCGHQSFLKSTFWNNVIGLVCSVFTTIPYTYWAKVHQFHHVHSGQLDTREIGDVNFLTIKEYQSLSPARQVGYRIFRTPIILFFLVPIGYLLYSNRFPLVFKEDKNNYLRQLRSNLIIGVIYVALGWLLGWQNFLLIQIPVLVIFVCVAFWFFYVQHQHELAYKHWKGNWDYVLSAIKGSTYYKLPRLFEWLTGNIGYHHIHHLNCGIPNYNLSRCAKENPILQKYVTIITLKQSLKIAHNKLWCEEQQRMITFSEYKTTK